MVSTKNFIAAIELGSSKLTGIAGRKNDDGSISVLAYAKKESASFIRRGVVFNVNKAAHALTSVIKELEDSVDGMIAKVYVGIGGQSMHGVMNRISRSMEETTIISQELVDAIRDENFALPYVDMEIFDAAPQEYKIGSNYQADPVGVAGNHIEGSFLNLVARSLLKNNLEHSFTSAKLPIADTLIAPLVTADITLTDKEKNAGCALIDFGADTITTSIYKGDILRYLTVIPLGSSSITRDITSLKIDDQEAEMLKLKYGNAIPEEKEKEKEEEEETKISLEDGREISLSLLNEIIEARTEELVDNMLNQIFLSGFEENLQAGIILTGGGANLKNIDELIRRKSKGRKVRIAKGINVEVNAPSGVVLKDCAHNTLLGLVAAGKENCCAPKPVVAEPQPQAIPAHIFDGDEDLNAKKAEIEAAKRKEEEDRKRRKKEEKETKKKKSNWFTDMKKGLGGLSEKLSDSIFNDDDMQ
nr:cell division protein FtsA [Bacteroides sp. 214]